VPWAVIDRRSSLDVGVDSTAEADAPVSSLIRDDADATLRTGAGAALRQGFLLPLNIDRGTR
jgi:hypothetical protein